MTNPRALKSKLDPQTEQAVRRFLEVAQEQFHPKGAIVFGSRARGTHRVDSDADVAVLLEGEHAGLVSTKMAMANLAFDVLMELAIGLTTRCLMQLELRFWLSWVVRKRILPRPIAA